MSFWLYAMMLLSIYVFITFSYTIHTSSDTSSKLISYYNHSPVTMTMFIILNNGSFTSGIFQNVYHLPDFITFVIIITHTY